MTGERRIQENVVVEDAGGVRIVRIDREEKLGALSTGIVGALGEVFASTRQDDDIRALILCGTGRGFIAGADIDEYADATAAEFMEYQYRSRQVFDALEALPQPTIAAVNGYAFGGGFEVALCCDFIVAGPWASFALPEVRLGLTPGGGGTVRLARAIGRQRAKELIMTGRVVKTAEAVEAGIALRADDSDVMITARRLAEELAARAPLAVRAAKQAIDGQQHQEAAAALTSEQRSLGALFATQDAQEGIRAFIEKREPRFIGR